MGLVGVDLLPQRVEWSGGGNVVRGVERRMFRGMCIGGGQVEETTAGGVEESEERAEWAVPDHSVQPRQAFKPAKRSHFPSSPSQSKRRDRSRVRRMTSHFFLFFSFLSATN